MFNYNDYKSDREIESRLVEITKEIRFLIEHDKNLASEVSRRGYWAVDVGNGTDSTITQISRLSAERKILGKMLSYNKPLNDS